MDNVALDVVIGLVFIYLLYSLYATVFIEIFTTILNLRAKNLYFAIGRMLKDEKQYPNPVHRYFVELYVTIVRFWGSAINLKNPELYNKVVNQPTIKYQTSGGLGNKPAYLTAESFSKALIDSIKVDNPDASLLACVEQGLENLRQESETTQHIRSLLDDANCDMVKFRILVETWYNETQDRAAGWFKQTTQVFLLFIGMILAFTFNVDTVAIIRKLSRDNEARNSLVQMAVGFSEKNGSIMQAVQATTPSESASVAMLNARLDSLTAVRHELEDDIQNSQSIMSSNWNISGKLYYSTKANDALPINYVDLPYSLGNRVKIYLHIHKSVDQDVISDMLGKELQIKNENGKDHIEISPTKYKLKYIFSEGRLWGYLLTVIAIAIGSPFWFDLLNKLVKLRNSNASSNDSGATGTSNSNMTNRGTLNRVG